MSEAASLELLEGLPLFDLNPPRVRAAPIAWCPFKRPEFAGGRLVVPVQVSADGKLVLIPVSIGVENHLLALKPVEGLAGWWLVAYPHGAISATRKDVFLASAKRVYA